MSLRRSAHVTWVGIDMALYLVERLTDEATARVVQLGIEYDPKPHGAIPWNTVDPTPEESRSLAECPTRPVPDTQPERHGEQHRDVGGAWEVQLIGEDPADQERGHG